MKGKRIGLFVTSSVQSRTAWAASGRHLYCYLTLLTGQATNFRTPSGDRPLLLHYDIECRRQQGQERSCTSSSSTPANASGAQRKCMRGAKTLVKRGVSPPWAVRLTPALPRYTPGADYQSLPMAPDAAQPTSGWHCTLLCFPVPAGCFWGTDLSLQGLRVSSRFRFRKC